MSNNYNNKRAVSSEKMTLAQIYSSTAGLQLNLIRSVYEDGTKSPYKCLIEMAKGTSHKDPNTRKNFVKCDWANKVTMQLTQTEMATLSKYSEAYFLKRLGTPVALYDKDTGEVLKSPTTGSPQTKVDSRGNVERYREVFVHKFDANSDAASLYLDRNNMDPMGLKISVYKGQNSASTYMSENIAREFTMACKIGFEEMVKSNVLSFVSKSASNNYQRSNNGYDCSYNNQNESYQSAPRSFRDNSAYKQAQPITEQYIPNNDEPVFDTAQMSSNDLVKDLDNFPF